jgi:magnesium transporter
MDATRRLEGVVTVKDLLMNPYEVTIGDIMDTHVIKAVTTEDQEAVADSFRKYGLLSLPVVDHEDRLVGIVTVDDVVDVIEQEATEDFEKMAAMIPSEKPYLKNQRVSAGEKQDHVASFTDDQQHGDRRNPGQI